jgi:hypothetical protein
MVASNSERKLALAVAFVFIAFASVFALLLYHGSRRTRILDTRFQITSVSVFRGTNRVVYFSNQLLGLAKERLAKLGFPVKPITHGIFTAVGTNLWVSVVYGGSLSPQELGGVEAQLVSSSGRIFKLYQGIRQPDPNTNHYLGAWLVDFSSQRFRSTNTPNYTLHLSLPDGGPRLAEIPLGRL